MPNRSSCFCTLQHARGDLSAVLLHHVTLLTAGQCQWPHHANHSQGIKSSIRIYSAAMYTGKERRYSMQKYHFSLYFCGLTSMFAGQIKKKKELKKKPVMQNNLKSKKSERMYNLCLFLFFFLLLLFLLLCGYRHRVPILFHTQHYKTSQHFLITTLRSILPLKPIDQI